MKFSTDREWLKKRAGMEDAAESIQVGGLMPDPTPSVMPTAREWLFNNVLSSVKRGRSITTTVDAISQWMEAYAQSQLADAKKLSDERFAEIQRAQRIIDDMKVNRESQIANIPHDVWGESAGTIHVAIKILRDRVADAKREIEELRQKVADLQHDLAEALRQQQ